MKERDYSFDIVKAILILLVVFGHSSRFGTAEAGIERTVNMIYVFHVSLFFFISGYFLSLEKLSLGRIGKHLVLPYLYAGIAYYFASWVSTGSLTPFGTWLVNAVCHNVGGASWFLCVLIWLNLIAWVFKRTRSKVGLCVLAMSAIVVLYKSCVSAVTPAQMFAGEVCFFVGVCLHGQSIAGVLRRMSPFAAIGFAVLIFAKAFRVAPFLEFPEIDWAIRFLALSSLFGLSLLIMRVDFLNRAFCFIGRSTLIIFLIHSLFNRVWLVPLKRLSSFDESGVIFLFVNTFFVVLSCLVVKVVINGGKKILSRR